MTPEEQRLEESHQRTKHWKRWGPYLSERQWGTVREDYSRGRNARGNIFRTSMRGRARIAGEKTASAGSATGTSGSASRWRCGTGAIPSSRSVCSG